MGTSQSLTTDASVERWVFLGNPGSGKSTIANCIARTPVFAAGLSFGSGKTVQTQAFEHDGLLLIDTPGLADTALRATAATEITKALGLAAGGPCKLFFVVTLRNGRATPEDVASITTILDSIAAPHVPFAIIINNVQRKQYELLTRGGAELKSVTASLCSGAFATPYIFVLPEVPQLSERDDALVEIPADVARVFHQQTPRFRLDASMVQPIPTDTTTFQSLVAASETLLHTYAADETAVEDKIQALSQVDSEFYTTLLWVVGLGFQVWLAMSTGIVVGA